MFSAVNKETKELVPAFIIGLDGSYFKNNNNEWYADPTMIIASPNIPKDKIPVKYKVGHTRERNGKEFAVAPHFFIPTKNKDNIHTTPESWEHKITVDWFYNQFHNNGSLTIKYGDFNKTHEFGTFIINNETCDLLKTKIEYIYRDKFDDSIRADVLIPLKKIHPILGLGIIIEVQFSTQSEKKTIERTIQRALYGYSTCWVTKNDIIINEKSDDKYEILLINSSPHCYACIPVQQHNNQEWINKKQNMNRLIDKKIIDGCEKLDNMLEKIRHLDGGSCPACGNDKINGGGRLVLKKNRNTNEEFWSCNRYPMCNGRKKRFPQ